MHCWKDSFGILLSFVVTAFLMTPTSSKWLLLMIPLSLWERKKITRGNIRWISRFFFQYDDVFLVQVLLNAQHTKSCYFSNMPRSLADNLPNSFLFHVQLICIHLNSQATIANHHLSYVVDVDFSPACWRPRAPGVICHLLAPLFQPLVPFKTRVCVMMLSLYTC